MHAAAWVAREGPRSVGLFASLDDEIDTRPLFATLREAGVLCVLPRCDGDALVFHAVSSWSELQPGRYGVLEPVAGPAYPFSPQDLVFVPGLAFDQRGGRLGRGRGFYDRCFPGPSGSGPQLVGLGYEAQRVDEVPMEAHDRRLDALASEVGVRTCGQAERSEARS